MSDMAFLFMAGLPLVLLALLAAQADPVYGVVVLLAAGALWFLNRRLRRR